jgi:glycosyltransferase involved in cell wall biosynthesis
MTQRALWNRWRDVFALFVANSGAMERRLRQHGIGPTRVIWNGVPRRGPRPPLTGPPVVAYAGRFSREKGVGVLIEAFARASRAVPEASLLLAGDGPERSALSARADELGIGPRVRWTGHLGRKEMERVLDSAWVVATPSILEEPFGLAAAEGMMRGTAILASNHGGLAEIVRDGETGVLVPPRDVDALGDAIAALLSDRARCEALGAEGHAWAWEMLSRKRCVDRFLDAYEEIA